MKNNLLSVFTNRFSPVCIGKGARALLLAVVLVATTGFASAQVKVGGIVRDVAGPIAGASVVLKGTTTGVSTGADGKFVISVPNATTAVLHVKFVGMRDMDVPLNGRTENIEVVMVEDAQSINEVVVTGYGSTVRANLTGSVGSISSMTLQTAPVTSAAEAMIGKVAGVQVTMADGSPGSEVNIRIRGGTSVTQSNQPLFIVDGFPVANINDIPPTEIQSLEILKDASQTAIYGARGGNGVVIIQTKGAKAGTVRVSANFFTQIRNLTKKLPVMNAYEFVKIQDEYASMSTGSRKKWRDAYGSAQDIELYKRYGGGSDWQEDVLGGNPLSYYYNVSVGGGKENLFFNISLTHNDDRGSLVGTGIKKTNLLTKLKAKISPNITLDFNPRIYYQQKDGDGTSGVSVIDALRYRPTDGLYQFGYVPSDIQNPDEESGHIYTAPSEQTKENYKQARTYLVSGQLGLTINFSKNWMFQTKGNVSFSTMDTDRYWGSLTEEAKKIGNRNMPLTEISKREDLNLNWINVLTWNKTVGEFHDLSALAGQELLSTNLKTRSNKTHFFPVDDDAKTALSNTGRGTPYTGTSTIQAPVRMLSFFGELGYVYKNKYIARATFRADASTMFAPGNQWGYFPSLSAAWVISREEFMKNQSVISFLKLRAAVGTSGNNRINADSWRFLFSTNVANPPGFGEPAGLPYYYTNADDNNYKPNPNIKWETTLTRNLALDIQMFDGKLSITPEVYMNTTSDLLYRAEIDNTEGYLYQMQNIAKTTNRGIELTLSGSALSRPNFSLNYNFNIGFNKSRIDRLNNNETQFLSRSSWGIEDGYDYVLKVGEQTGLIYGYVNDGFYTLDGFYFSPGSGKWLPVDPSSMVDCEAMFGTTPGAPKYKNFVDGYKNAEDINKVNDGDMVVIGNTNPKFSGGFGVDGVFLKNFDFTVFFNYIYGFDVNNINKFRLSSWWKNDGIYGSNLLEDFNVDRRWRYANDLGQKVHDGQSYAAEYAALNANAKTYNPQKISRAVSQSDNVEDGSFLRLQTLMLGYTLPERITKKFAVSKLRLYFTGYNLFTWTNYSGYDPEVHIQEGLTPGIDNNVYPKSRQYTFGVNITF